MNFSDNFQIKLTSPTVHEFLMLREQIGWQSVSEIDAQTSLQNSLFHVTIYIGEQLVGMGRVVGDGVMYFYIQDVVVAPDFQRCGIGAALMEKIENYLLSVAKKGSTIGLLAAKGKESFYSRYGYLERPSAVLGRGMCKFI